MLMLTIWNKELKTYFTSPIGYVFICFFLFMFGLYFMGINVLGQNGDYTYVLSSLTIFLFFATPLLTMRLLSEEKRTRTDQLLLTAPIKIQGIILGKFLAATTLLAITLILTLVHPLLLALTGVIPVLKILSCYLGYWLLGSTLIAIGLFISALTENQIVAAISSIACFSFLLLADGIASLIPSTRGAALVFVLLLLILVTFIIHSATSSFLISGLTGSIGLLALLGCYFIKGSLFEGLPAKILKWFSVYQRFDNFTNGLLDGGTIVYYLSFIGVFLFLTQQAIEKHSWN